MVAVAVDIGQTQARIRVLSAAAPELQVSGFSYGANLLAVIPEIVAEAAKRLQLATIDAIGVGSTGLYGSVPAIDALAEDLHRRYGVKRVVVADDAVNAYLGAVGAAPGVVVAAGTGMVGLGHGPKGTARVDGVGGMIGDDGAGWWIGRRGLIAAISAADGRPHASDDLLDRLEARFGPVADFAATVAADSSPVAVVASFAKDVADAARAGDAVAARIWTEAGTHIGGVVVAAAERSGLADGFRWALIGRLGAASDLLEGGWAQILGERFPGATRVAPLGEPLDGVAQLLDLGPADFGPLVREVRIR